MIDDGSTDNSPKICDEYKEKDERIKVIHQENVGLGKARNKGLKIAKGEYVGFVDSDDWIAPDFYEKLYNEAKTFDYEVVVAKTIDFFGKGNKYIELPERNEKSIYFKDVVWDSLYKKTFLNKNNIVFPNSRIFEDVLFSLMIDTFVERRFFHVNTYYYRRKDRKNSIMYNYRKKFNPQNRLDILDLCQKFLYTIEGSDLYTKAEKIFNPQKILYLFEILENDKSFFDYVKNEVKNIDFCDNEYICPYLKKRCEKLLNSKNYREFNNFSNVMFLIIKNKIIYIIYIILLKLGIKDIVKKILQKLGYRFDE